MRILLLTGRKRRAEGSDEDMGRKEGGTVEGEGE